MIKTHLTQRQDALCAALALLHVEGIGPAITQRLYQHFGSAMAVLSACHDELRELGLPPKLIAGIRHPNWAMVDADLRWQLDESCFILHFDHPDYPALLREIHVPPFVLFVKGDVDVLSRPQIAIVGSRTPTSIGADNAYSFAGALSEKFVVTSGLALGVDAASHRGALAVGAKTIAVMGAGLDTIYPSRHKLLASKIMENGALVSEFSPGVGVERHHFPRRNRVISGLSLGTLVVEAALKSGSLITARYALEAGREVFALPGSIHNPLARGCHHLIGEGATLVSCVDDVLGQFEFAREQPVEVSVANEKVELSPDAKRVLAYIDEGVVSVDSLIEKTAITPDAISSILLILELQGMIESVQGGVRCTRKSYQVVDI